jgi:hypothetical protein
MQLTFWWPGVPYKVELQNLTRFQSDRTTFEVYTLEKLLEKLEKDHPGVRLKYYIKSDSGQRSNPNLSSLLLHAWSGSQNLWMVETARPCDTDMPQDDYVLAAPESEARGGVPG